MPNCPQCDEELSSGDPRGLCPNCLILGAFDSSAGADESGTQTIDRAAAPDVDDDFGRYQIVQSIGEGGMGTVYLADQLEPIHRRVATLLWNLITHLLHALAALGGASPPRAWSICKSTLRYELAGNGLNFNYYYLGGLHSAWVRGQAFIAMHRYTEAAAEFQKILDHRAAPGGSEFPTTRWTVVVAADDPQRKEARSALASLCENYWYPLYAYLRRRGYPADQAQDLTQEFFIRVLEGRYLDRADPEKGRFRSFLMTSLKFFVADEEDRLRAHKRGGGALVPLLSSGEEHYQCEPAHDETPERIFERRWALAVLDRVVERLRMEFVQHGRPEHFERLKVFLLGHSDAPYAALAREMNTSEGALKVAIHRLRKRYRELFRQEIADTVADPADVESELRFWRPY